MYKHYSCCKYYRGNFITCITELLIKYDKKFTYYDYSIGIPKSALDMNLNR